MTSGTWRRALLKSPTFSATYRLRSDRTAATLRQDDPRPLHGVKTQVSCCQRIALPRCCAPSARQRAILQVARRYLDPLGRKCLGNDPTLGRASAQRVVGQCIKSSLGEAHRQHRRPVRPNRVRDRRWLLWSSRARCLQHFGRGKGRGASGALEPFHQGVPDALMCCVLVSCVMRPASGSQPRLRSSANRAVVSAPALPPGMRPEKPISP